MLEREKSQLKSALAARENALATYKIFHFTVDTWRAILWSMRGLRITRKPPSVKGLSGFCRGRELDCYGELPQTHVKSPFPSSFLKFNFDEPGHMPPFVEGSA
jgi:hypothetical protein